LTEVDIPAEIARREDRLAAIAAARERLEKRQREADLERGRDEGAQAEWKLVAAALNLRRMSTLRTC
jgi:hypothetical protein